MARMDRSALAYWETFAGASRGWISPIAPAPEDTVVVEHAVRAHGGAAPRALLLGVTQSLARMRWPDGCALLALDWSLAMIRHVWQAAPALGHAFAARGDWREMPLPERSRDVVVGDGCFSAAGSRHDAELVVREVHRVLVPGGLFCLRNFARPAAGLQPDAVAGDVAENRFPDPFFFRWMLAIAVHGTSPGGVRLHDVWSEWNRRGPRLRPVLERLGWLDDAEWAFGRWKDVGMRYWYPDARELRELVAPHFELIEYRVPGYLRGECFPTLVMRARA